MAEAIHGVGMIHQGMIERRERIANGCCKHKNRESSGIHASQFVVSASEVPQEVPFAEEEDSGRNEMGIDDDRLVVKIPPTLERHAGRVCYGPVATDDALIVVVLKPFWHSIEREKSRAPWLPRFRLECIVLRSTLSTRIWFVERTS